MNQCVHCWKCFHNIKVLNGHLSQCRLKRSALVSSPPRIMEAVPHDDIIVSDISYRDDYIDDYSDDNDDMTCGVDNLCVLLFQKLLLEKLKLKETSLGKVKSYNSKYSKPELLTYLDVCDTLMCSIGGLSESDSTEIIKLIKRASGKHNGSEVPLPSRYYFKYVFYIFNNNFYVFLTCSLHF